jgi:nucleoid DNA-binding protein
MTRSELVTALAQRFPQLVQQQDADLAVKEILTAISASLVEGVERKFGDLALSS